MAENKGLFDRIYRSIRGRLPGRFKGSERSISRGKGSLATLAARRGDLEIYEYPIRDYETARLMLEMREWCPEMGFAIECHKEDVVSSADGDDQGIIIAPYKEGNEEVPLNPDVKAIASGIIDRLFPNDEIGVIVDRLLSTGDCFGNLDIDAKSKTVRGLLLLPTYEIWRVEERGRLLRFEQREFAGQTSGQIQFHPITIAHWRYNRRYLYGRGLFFSSREDWGRLRDAADDLSQATRDAGLIPMIHSLPDSWQKGQRDEYRMEHEKLLAAGVITHYYPYGGVEIDRLANGSPQVKALLDNMEMWRKRIAVTSRLPLFRFGLQMTGAKDISGQPAEAHSRFINSLRGIIGRGIRQCIDTELALNEIDPRKPENRYRIAWPIFYVRPGNSDESANADTEHTGEGDRGDEQEKNNVIELKAS